MPGWKAQLTFDAPLQEKVTGDVNVAFGATAIVILAEEPPVMIADPWLAEMVKFGASVVMV